MQRNGILSGGSGGAALFQSSQEDYDVSYKVRTGLSAGLLKVNLGISCIVRGNSWS